VYFSGTWDSQEEPQSGCRTERENDWSQQHLALYVAFRAESEGERWGKRMMMTAQGKRIGYIVAGILAVIVLMIAARLAFWSLTGQTEILFFGKVADQQGAPIAGARVTVNARESIWIMWARDRRATVTTDNQGRFAVSRHTYAKVFLRGCFLFIENIEKPGYAFSRPDNPTTFDFQRSHVDRHNPRVTAPVLFSMIKGDDSPNQVPEDTARKLADPQH